jgi:hypothetical protein
LNSLADPINGMANYSQPIDSSKISSFTAGVAKALEDCSAQVGVCYFDLINQNQAIQKLQQAAQQQDIESIVT